METYFKRRNDLDRAIKVLVILLVIFSIVPLFLVLFYIVKMGIQEINWNFLAHNPVPLGEKGGGVFNALVGSFLLICISSLIFVPIGMATGIFLNLRSKTRMAYYVGWSMDILQGIPSIVVGIVIYFWLVEPFGSFSALAGSLALGIIMLPLVVRSTEQTLSLLPETLTESGLALGIPLYRVIWKIIIPCGFSGILSGIMVSVSRIAGESAPLLFTAFGNPYLSFDITKPIQSLPMIIFTYAYSPYSEWHKLAWGSSLLLLILVFLMNRSSKYISRKWKVQF